MKITDIRIEKLEIPLNQPFTTSFGTTYSTENWIVKLSTDEGIVGYGSASPLAFVTGETPETTYIVLQMLAKALIGVDPTDIEGVHRLMDSIIYGNGSAKCAIDIALYDVAGKVKNMPLYRHVGGRNPVVINDVTVGIDTPSRMEEEARRYVFEKGFRILKVKTGISPSDDIEALTRIRKAVGNDIILRTDANQAYTIETALDVLGEFEKIGVSAVEQCLSWWDLDGASELKRRNRTSVKLMLDESIHNSHDAARVGQLRCADYINIKLMKCGGLYEGCKIADIAENTGLRCMVGCMIEDRISLTAGISLDAA